jgi:hypothetical protein
VCVGALCAFIIVRYINYICILFSHLFISVRVGIVVVLSGTVYRCHHHNMISDRRYMACIQPDVSAL